MNASHISRTLRAAGFNPVSNENRNREGIRVTGSGSEVRVSADLDSDRQATRLANEAAEALAGLGFTVRAASPAAFYVTGRA